MIARVSFAPNAAPAALSIDSYRRVPTFDVMGSLFPAWLVCLAAAILLTVAIRWLLMRLRIPLVFPVVIYPSLTALVTFALWLAFFR
jgi:hypothetical protein